MNIFNDTEDWRPIKGYEGLYEVSSMGNVRSLDAHICNGKSTRLRKGRIIQFGIQNSGYYQAPIWKDNKGYSALVHRLVAEAFIPNPDNKEFVNHIDGNKMNNVVTNLEWVTRLENHQHANKLGLLCKGENHYACKLLWADVLRIRELAQLGVRVKDLARVFDANPSVVCGIVKGRHRVNA